MSKVFHRTFSIARDGAAIDVTARTVPLAFSSEAPYERWFGIEILDHAPGACDLSRLADGRHPLLLNHDIDDQVGVVESAAIDGDKIGRASVRFGRGQLANEIFQDVQDGIRSLVSVGYMIDELEAAVDGEEKSRKFCWDEFNAHMRALHGEQAMTRAASNRERAAGDTDPVFRVTKWTPFEISIVSIPADASVGVGRSASVETEVGNTPVTGVAAAGRAESAEQIVTLELTPSPILLKEQKMSDPIELKGEQKRVADLYTISDQYEKYGSREMVQEYVLGGKSPEAFKDAIMSKMSTRHTSSKDMEIGLTNKEVKDYSLIRAINAAANKDWKEAGFEREVSDAIGQKMGVRAQGFYVPVEAFGWRAGFQTRAGFDATVTASTAGNLIQTSVEGNEFVDVLRNKLVFNRLGIRVLGGLTSNIAIPRKSAASTVQNLAETTQFTASNPTTTQVALAPKRVGGSIPYSKQALIQSSLDIESMLRDDLLQTIAVMIENLGFNGSGTAPAPRGLVNQSGIGSVVGGVNGAQILWSHLVGLESACANANAEPNARAGYAVNTRARGWMKSSQKATYLPYIWNVDNPDAPLNGYIAAVSNNLPSNGTKGTAAGITSTLAFSSDWSNFVLALFGGLDVVVDPYSLADSGQVKITANQFIDIALRQPAAFAVMTDALTA